ncbi:MAG: TrkH family potassium uptake protein, partial [Firmicutes bacterium]|nr:TrkH family potassium uptake protein [Bacillota bacterium]
MNLMVIFKIVGRVLLIEAAAMLPSLLVALIYNEDLKPFILSIAIVLIVGGILSALPARKGFYSREGFVAVGLIWLLTGLVGALPFWFSGCFASLADCIFESCSGFTTTGASVLTDIEALPHGILFWRSFTHWLGGMGVLVLATALLPLMGVRSHYLTQAESPGPVFAKLVPRQSQTSKILYAIYCSLTLLQIVLLRLAGMPLYDSFIHAFGTAGTGGFSNRNASIGAYDSVAIEMIISVFILLFSINFAIHFLILTRRFREVRQSDELRFFLTVVTGATVLI